MTPEELEKKSGIPIHPAANLFPMLEADGYRGLVDDIFANGQQFPIILHEDVLIDGRNRLRACREAGVDPEFAQLKDVQVRPGGDAAEIDPIDYIISANLARRHLTDDQRVALVAELFSDKWAKDAEVRMNEGRKEGGRGNKKNSGLNSTQSLRTREKLQETAKVSQHKARQALAVQNEDPESLKKVISGEKTLQDAADGKKVQAAKAKKKAACKKAQRKPKTPEKMSRKEWIETQVGDDVDKLVLAKLLPAIDSIQKQEGFHGLDRLRKIVEMGVTAENYKQTYKVS